jgi:dTDP-4-dehydrorhamnose 3,5-epimerase
VGGIFDVFMGGLTAADETGRRMLLRESDNILGRFGEAVWREIGPGRVLPFMLRENADRVWILIEGELWAVMHDTREGVPSRGQTQAVRLDGRPNALLLIPFGVACAARAIGGGPARLLELSSHEEEQGAPARIFAADDPVIGFDWSTLTG